MVDQKEREKPSKNVIINVNKDSSPDKKGKLDDNKIRKYTCSGDTDTLEGHGHARRHRHGHGTARSRSRHGHGHGTARPNQGSTGSLWPKN